MKYFIYILLIGSYLCTLSNVAFTSREEMNRHSAQVEKNIMVRNSNPTEENKHCSYFREYVVKYLLNNHDHRAIWYFVMQCYDEDFKQVGDDVYSFNYDGDENNLFKLPPGCPPPAVEDKKKNPCENGIALGDQLYKDIAEIYTKKLTEHPLSVPGDESNLPTSTTTTRDEQTGVETTTYPDGTELVKSPDGSSLKTLPDGTTVEKDTTGVQTTKRPDGSVYVKNPDHSTVATLPDSSVYTENPDRTTRVVRDGVVYEEDTKGNVKVTEPNGVVHVTHPDGTVSVELPNDQEETHSLDENNNPVVTLNDGTTLKETVNGTVVEEPNGTVHTQNEDNSVNVTRPDGTVVDVSPEGVSLATLPDGSTVETVPSSEPNTEPTVTLRNPEGEEVDSVTGSSEPVTSTSEDGTTTTRNPDGSSVTTKPDETVVEEKPDGSSVTTNPDGSVKEVAPNGEVTLKDPEGNVVNVYNPDGSSNKELPDGTVVEKTPEGVTTSTMPDGVTVVRQPDGSAVVEDPNTNETTNINPDGSSVTTKPDGTVVTVNSNGSSLEERPDKSVLETDTDGKTTLKTPSESDPNVMETTVVYADGTVSPSPNTEEQPNTSPLVGETNEDGLEVVSKKITELEEQLTQSLLNSMKQTPEEINNTVDPDGTRTVVYQYPDGTESTVVESNDGTVTVTTVEGSTKKINEVVYNPEDKTLVKRLKDPEGNLESYSVHNAKLDDPNVEVVTRYTADDVQIGLPEERPATYDFLDPKSSLVDLNVTPELENTFLSAGTDFANVVEQYVDNNVKCFLENVLKEREQYLTFVCAHSEHKSIREVLFAKFGENTICHNINCDALERELIDRMIAANNNNESTQGISVVSQSIGTEIVDHDAVGTQMTGEPTLANSP